MCNCNCCRFGCHCCPTLRCVCVFSSKATQNSFQASATARQVQQQQASPKLHPKLPLSHLPFPHPLLHPCCSSSLLCFIASAHFRCQLSPQSAHSERDLDQQLAVAYVSKLPLRLALAKGAVQGSTVKGSVAKHPLKRKLPALLSLSLFAVATFWRLLRMVSCHMRWRKKAAAAHMPHAPTLAPLKQQWLLWRILQDTRWQLFTFAATFSHLCRQLLLLLLPLSLNFNRGICHGN